MKPTPKLKMKSILNTKAGFQFSQSECCILSTLEAFWMWKLPTRPDNLKSVRDLASQVEKTSKTALDANNKMDDVSSIVPCESLKSISNPF